MAYPTGWTLRHKIVFDHTKVSGGSDISNYPALITEANLFSSIFSNSDNGGGDVRFSSDEAGSTQLACEIVTWNTGTSKAEVWVKIPTLASATDTTIYIWTRPGQSEVQPIASDTYGKNSVWDSNYKGVWHLENNYNDSTSNAYNMQNGTAPTFTSSGQVGGGYDFESTNSQYITIPDASGSGLETSGARTMDVVFKTESHTVTAVPIGKKNSSLQKEQSIYISGNSTIHAYLDGLTAGNDVNSSVNPSDGTWYHAVQIYDPANGKHRIIVNGTEVNANAGGNVTDTDGNLSIGRNGSSNAGYFDGVIGEASFSNTARTVGYAVTRYNNLMSTSTFSTPLGIVSDTVTLIYNIIAHAYDTVTLKYNIYQLASDTVTLKYNILNIISDTLTLIYNIQAGVAAKTLTLIYNIYQVASDTVTLKYNIYQLASDTVTLIYNIIGKVVKTLTLRYNIYQIVSDTVTLIYNILTRAYDTLTLIYLITGTAAGQLILKYNIEEFFEGIREIPHYLAVKIIKPVPGKISKAVPLFAKVVKGS